MNSDLRRRVSRLTKNTMAVVLAGGRGSRLAQLTEFRAKPAVPFGGKYRIIDFTLSNCVNSNIRRICVLTQYKSHYLFKHIQQGWHHFNHEHGEFVDLIPPQQWIDEQSWYQGTADAVYQSLDIIESHHPDFLLVLAGDHIYKMDYSEMLAAHVEAGADFTIACKKVPHADAGAFGIMEVDENYRVVNFEEKPAAPKSIPDDPDTALASMGIYVFSIEYLREHLARDAAKASSTHDFGHDLIPYAIRNAHKVHAHAYRSPAIGAPDYWRDVGTIEAYYQANLELLSRDPPLRIDDPDWPVFTYQPQAPPARFIGRQNMNKADNVMISGGCIVNRSELADTILFSNVRVDQGCRINGSLVLPTATIGTGCVLQNVIVDNGCRVPSGSVIGGDPERDRNRYSVTDSGVTVVTRTMLGDRPRRHLAHLQSEQDSAEEGQSR